MALKGLVLLISSWWQCWKGVTRFFLEGGAVQTLLMDSPSSGTSQNQERNPEPGPGPFLPQEPFLKTTGLLTAGMGLRGTGKGNLLKKNN